MAGIYIHIPFCKQACHYCNFHFATSLHYKTEMLTALRKEIELRKNYLPAEQIETIYFGGGTPSLLGVDEIEQLMQQCKLCFDVAANAEITLEANPDDITKETLKNWQEVGINRLSIGVQSFFEQDLQWMNRAHSSHQAKESLQLAKEHFENITIDLIFGTPDLSNENWIHNVETAISLNIPHLSCYALTVEPQTALQKMIKQKKTKNINIDKQAEQFSLLVNLLQTAGYEQYEISNFAKPGWRSKHNSSYWRGVQYVGIGPSAHSYNLHSRQWNIANNQQYIEAINNGLLPTETEELTSSQKLNEYIMTSLRTMEGIDLNRFSKSEQESILEAVKPYFSTEKAILKGSCIVLTDEGKLFADGIAADLFFN